MLTVGDDVVSVESRLVAGELACPVCGGVLVRWGWASARVLRGFGQARVRLRPRRACCSDCGRTHVLLASVALLRRADLAAVIGTGLEGRAAGLGARRVAERLGRPVETARRWLSRFGGRAGRVWAMFTRLLVEVGVDVPPPAESGVFAGAVAAVLGAGRAVGSRWPSLAGVSPWRVAAAVTNGTLLAPVLAVAAPPNS